MHKLIILLVGAMSIAIGLSGPVLASSSPSPKPSPKTTIKEASVKADTPPPPKTYVVSDGDSLSSIATTEKLSSWVQLWNVNPSLTDPNLIYAGEQLIVPVGPTTDRPLPANVVPEPVAATTAPAPVTQISQPAPANYSGGVGGILARVRARESGGNYADNTGNGYYGAYQFNLGTWRGVGGSGLPSDASPAEQDMRAQMLYNERGCSPWPNTCY